MNKKLIVTLMIASAIGVTARATTLYTIAGAELDDASAVAIPQLSLAVLVIDSTGDGFAPLNGGESLTIGASWGNDTVLQIEDLTAGGTDGLYLGAVTVTYGGTITSGDKMILYWFPTLTLSSTVLSNGDPFGSYRDDVGLDGGAPWSLPADTGASLALNALTVSYGGSLADGSLLANQVVPEPSTLVLVGLGLLGMAALRRRSA